MTINVTQPFLPPIEDYQSLVNDIWKRQWLTNHGPLVCELEEKLKQELNIPYLLYVTNGTIALQLAIQALRLSDEIITTSFSYVATANSILWEKCEAVFVDIDPETLNICCDAIDKAITPKTSAILATHVFGNPCDIDRIEHIAQRHNLKVIYDGAHGFGSIYKKRSLLSYGDISTCSFHATKLFHTIEGGMVTTHDSELIKRLAKLRNFGHSGTNEFDEIGINGKNSELHAAMGLCNLPYLQTIISQRQYLVEHYKQRLAHLDLKFQRIQTNTEYNYAYMPVIFADEVSLLACERALNKLSINPRRYFYPSLSTLPYLTKQYSTPIANSIAKRILCLPLFYGLSVADVDAICDSIQETLS